jgi:DHA1 family multidrug resistance protein-like MFS transporter
LLKALTMLVHEPVIIYLTSLLSLAYFVFFGYLEALPVIYGDIHGLELYQVGLCFVPILIGAGLATLGSMPLARAYARETKRGSTMPPPERRLIPLIIGGFILPISLFWQGWAGGYAGGESFRRIATRRRSLCWSRTVSCRA